MTNILLGFAIIAVGVFLAWLYRQWARVDADGRKKMSERKFQKSQPQRKPATARVGDAGPTHGKRSGAPQFGRR